MTIKIGVYDFFAYTISGLFYLMGGLYILVTFMTFDFDFQMVNNLSIVSLFFLALFAYVCGLIFDRLARRWSEFFRSQNLPSDAFNEFKSFHPNLELKFQYEDWSILLAYIRKEKPDAGSDIDRLNAIGMTLRNISFVLAILGSLHLVQFIWISSWENIGMAFIYICAAWLAVRESAKFQKWFLHSIYTVTVASCLPLSDLATWRRDLSSIPPEF